jgi:hypothetical protein
VFLRKGRALKCRAVGGVRFVAHNGLKASVAPKQQFDHLVGAIEQKIDSRSAAW